MSVTVSKEVLDGLTDVAMPRLPPAPVVERYLDLGHYRVPVVSAQAVVVGSGAAGLRAAIELRRRGVDVAILSQSAWGGTSACSGSDKQTLHTANSAGRGDDLQAMAQAIRAGGAMDEDMAYVEAVGSLRAMASLQYLGLPLPQDTLGGILRYQTDHDDVGRATSCGPRTSRLMVKVLAQEALALQIPFYNQTTVVKLLKEGGNIQGVLAIGKDSGADNPYGLMLFHAPNVVLAGGGPGELYRDSVFPNGCFGTLGLAAEAGIDLVNLTESQFGISTRREGFPWNLSGTYVQVIPHIYSLDAEGREHHFLRDYYPSMAELASNIFRKGYQWPFHASRMLDFKSSLIDLAIVIETRKGRRVMMDFNRNPLPTRDGLAFSLSLLEEDARNYLQSAGAAQDLPIARLAHMNPLAIELYRRYKIDIATDPLEFSVNNQHMNGGIAIDIWGRSSLGGLYAAGEAAGSHGATRPGGAALNSGQVIATRVAEHIAAKAPRECALPQDAARQAIAEIAALTGNTGGIAIRDIKAEVQNRMSDAAGILCRPDVVSHAKAQAEDLLARLKAQGIALERPSELARALQWQQTALASAAVLTALDHYIAAGGGSRGARAICEEGAPAIPQGADGPLMAYRFRPERDDDKGQQLVLRYGMKGFTLWSRPNRGHDTSDQPFFERDWGAWLMGDIYDEKA